MDTYTPQETVAPVAPQPKKQSPLWIIIAAVVVLAAIALAAFFLFKEKPEPVSFPIIENGQTAWYTLSETTLVKGEMPEDYLSVPQTLLSEGDFSAVYAENGSVVTMNSRGVETFGADQVRALLIDRAGLDYGSSVLNKDASAALVYNESTNALDLFLLDRTRPLVLTYVGSLPVERELYGVAFVDTTRFVVRTGEESFSLYTYSETDILASGTLMLSSKVSFFSVPKAHAWTYAAAPTSAGATTASGYRCTGAQVATLGTASGSGTMPSVQTTVWSYMPTPGNLPASYNNGNYCIQAKTTVTVGGGDDDGPGPGGGNEVFESLFPRVHAQASSWTIQYTAHTGSGKTAATDYYALTYTAVSSVTLSASPTTVVQGGSPLAATALTWSSANTSSCTGTGFSTGGATSGTVSVSPTETTTYSISCTGTSGTVSDSEVVTVVYYPNLAAGGVTPTTAAQGTALTVSATVSNSASVSTGAGFTTLFQQATDASGTGATDIGTYTHASALGAGASAVASVSHTFSTGGIWYVRSCADKTNSASSGAITESNESDNCGAWTAITVSGESGEDVTAELTVSASTIQSGDPVTLEWDSTGAESCTGTGFSTGNSTSGSVVVSPTDTTTYVLYCSGGAGSGGGGGDGINVPFAINEWWTGGTSETIYSEAMHNNDFSQFEQGYGIEELCASYAGEHQAWNLQVRETDNVGDAGTNIMYLTCYGVNNPTGTTAKPQETIYRPQGEPDVITYARSDSTPGDTGGVGVAIATVTVEAGTECTDEDDNDRDGLVDEQDPGCDVGDGDTESADAALSCAVSNSTPQAGGSATYTVTPSGGAEAPYTWAPLSGQTCEGGDDTTENCTFPLPQIYQMRVTADGGETTLCPYVDTSCSLDSVSISASPDRVRAGNQTTVTWEADTSCNCSVSGPGLSSSEPNDSQAVTVTGQSRYTISCQAGAAEDFVIVNIVPTLIEF